VSRTFQTPRLVPNLSALENVMVGGGRHHRRGHIAELFGLPAARHDERAQRERARELLATFGLGAQPQRQASGFPIGSQKIIEVARALLNDPVLLLLDEPAAGLNDSETLALMQTIHDIRDRFKIAILLIEHNMELVMGICERIVVLNFGKTIKVGTPEEVRCDEAVIEAYLGEPAEAAH
jgi:branched-chain amino acid transport system ATP-binding protein